MTKITKRAIVAAAEMELEMSRDEIKGYVMEGLENISGGAFEDLQNFVECAKRAKAFIAFMSGTGEYNDLVKEGFSVYADIAEAHAEE